MAIQTQYCRCWYLISAACMIAYAQAADITWLQWTGQSGGYIGLSSETSRVPLSGVAPICSLEGGAILDPAVVDVTSKEFATLIVECLNIDITNFNFWVNGSEEEGHCPGIVLQNKLFRSTYFVCTTQTRYICYSTEDKEAESCESTTTGSSTTDNIHGASSTTDTITGESSTTDTIPGESSTTDTITGESSTTDTIPGESSTTDTIPGIAVYGGAAAGGVVFLVVVIVVAVCCARKKNNHDKQRQPDDQEAPEVSQSTDHKGADIEVTPTVPSYEHVPNTNFMPKPKPVEETEDQETEKEQEQEDVSPYAEYDGGAAVVDIPPVNNTPEKSPAADFKPGDNDKPPDIEPLYSDVRKNGATLGDAVVNENKEKVTTPEADMYASVNKPKREESEGDLSDDDTEDVVVDNPLYSSM